MKDAQTIISQYAGMRRDVRGRHQEAANLIMGLDIAEAIQCISAIEKGECDNIGLSPRSIGEVTQMLLQVKHSFSGDRGRALRGAYYKGRVAFGSRQPCVSPYADKRTTSGKITYSRAFQDSWIRGWKDAQHAELQMDSYSARFAALEKAGLAP